MALHQTNDAPLCAVLKINGFFSAASGLVCILKSNLLADLLFQQPLRMLKLSIPTLIFGLGMGLLVFAALVLVTTQQRITNRRQVKLISALDVGWVVGSGVLLTVFIHYFSGLGMAIVVGVAIIISIFAAGQILGLAILYQGKNKIAVARRGACLTLTASTVTRATPEKVWQVMSDQEGYAMVADNIKQVDVIEGQGYGMTRKCTDNDGQSWYENCTCWDDGRAFAFKVDTEAEDYPYPISTLMGKWSLIPKPDHTQISMTFNITAKSGLLNRLLLTLMIAPFIKVCDRLLNNWVVLMEDNVAPSSQQLTTSNSVQHVV